MADYREVTACRLCDSTELASVLDLGETPLANELGPPMLSSAKGPPQELFPLVVNRCGSCGHHQLSIAVSPERLWGPSYPYQSGTSPVFRKHLEALADEVAALKPGGRVLEIASNDGTLCRMLATRGLDALGIDPSGPQHVGADYALWQEPWPCNHLAKNTDGTGEQDIVLALNVFAHVDDLHGFTAAVKEALAPDGVFIVEVGRCGDVIARNLFDVVYHEHMSYHDEDSLAEFFDRHGLYVSKVERNGSQGGSMRLYVRHASETDPVFFPDVQPSMESLIGYVNARAAALRTALNKLFQREEMVCIYGAPAKLTTLLYATGLQGMPFNCVGDDNPRKVGRTTPGNHIPIVSVDDMLARKPDTILVASWNFFDDIRQKLRDKGFKGGIINPMGASE